MSNFFKQKPLILASGSAIRKKLLASLGLDFKVIPANCNEEKIKQECQLEAMSFINMANELAKAKALLVSKAHPDAYVLAADQLCVQDKHYFDKPLNHETAVANLNFLSGKTHQQIAALCLAKGGEIIWEYQETASLTMYVLEKETIEAYLKRDKPYHSCGAYQYEGQGKWLFKEVIGTEDTILGLPLSPLKKAFIDLGIVELNK